MTVTETIGLDKNKIETIERVDSERGTTIVIYPFPFHPHPRRAYITVQNKRSGSPGKMTTAKVTVETQGLNVVEAEQFGKAYRQAILLAEKLDDENMID